MRHPFHGTATSLLAMVAALLTLGAAACDEDDLTGTENVYDLTFSGDATYGAAHADQTIHVVVQTDEGTDVASDEATVSGTGDPAFSIEFGDVLEDGESYVIKYWIDSNFEDGTEGVCDEPTDDHQWQLGATDLASLGNVSGPLMIVDTHRPADVEEICSTL